MRDDFAVGVASEPMVSHKAGAKVLVIVDFAITDQGNGLRFVEQGLAAPFWVNDRQPAEAKRHIGPEMNLLIVRSTMSDLFHLGAQRHAVLLWRDGSSVEADDSCYATHEPRSAESLARFRVRRMMNA